MSVQIWVNLFCRDFFFERAKKHLWPLDNISDLDMNDAEGISSGSIHLLTISDLGGVVRCQRDFGK